MKHDELLPHLEEAFQTFSPSPTDHQRRAMSAHWELVCRWNQRINLTAISEPREAAFLHYRDSLEGLPWLGDGPVVDMGSGAGYPGVPLAIVRPDLNFLLVEPRNKRVSFLRTVVATLGLRNVDIHAGKHTDVPRVRASAVVTRATFSDPADIGACSKWLQDSGCLVAYRNAAGIADAQMHEYSLLGSPRRIEIWRLPGETR